MLLLAYACSPEHGSEGGIGWHRAVECARRFDTWVIMADNFYADGVRRHLAAHGEIPGLQFVFVAKSRWQEVLERVPGCFYVVYHLWHKQAFRKAAELHEQFRFDLVHQINFCGYREPGYLWKLSAPFIWGPVGGTQDYPWRFLGEAGFLGAIAEGSRSLGNQLQLRFDRRVRQAARHAKVLLAANSTNQRDFTRIHGIVPQLMLETGIETAMTKGRRRDSSRTEIRILWSGAFIPRKCLSLLLRALALLPADCSYQVKVLGRGPRRRAWQRLARRLRVDGRIQWIGWLPHDQVLHQYHWADLFVFTSLRDTSGNVVLEALACGLPVICLDHQGMHDVVAEDCGVKIPVTNRRDVIKRLAEAIVLLAKDQDRWERCSVAALRRAEEYHWTRQGERMAAVYHQALGINEPPPQTVSLVSDEGPASEPPAHTFVDDSIRGLTSTAQRATPTGVRADNSSCPAFRRDAQQHWCKEWGKRAAAWTGAAMNRLAGGPVRTGGAGEAENFGIFNYHRVAPHVPGVPKPTINVTPLQLRQHLAGLLDRGYVIRSLSEMLRHHRLGLSVPPRTVVLTFDDGFASVYTQAWPILQEFRAPATIFLCTAYLDSDAPFPFDGWGETHHERSSCRKLASAAGRRMPRDALERTRGIRSSYPYPSGFSHPT